MKPRNFIFSDLNIFASRYHVNFNNDKRRLIDYAFKKCKPVPVSFADLGGIWNVDGAYTFYTLEKYKTLHAYLADTDFTNDSLSRSSSNPVLKVIKGNFGDDEVYSQIDRVDAIFLFDVLLHQVKPDWNEILQIYSERTDCFVIYNPQWLGSEKTVRLPDLGQEEYFRNVPHTFEEPNYRSLFEKMNEVHPQHNRRWRDIHNVWQWAITDRDLISTLEKLGFVLLHYKNYGRFGTLINFENHGFVFKKETKRSSG